MRATCPLCHADLDTFVWNTKRIFPFHGAYMEGDGCPASAWIVEDDDLDENRRVPLAAACVAVVRAADGPMHTLDVLAALEAQGRRPGRGSVATALSHAHRAGHLVKPSRAVWAQA